jgi:hypothetical protein
MPRGFIVLESNSSDPGRPAASIEPLFPILTKAKLRWELDFLSAELQLQLDRNARAPRRGAGWGRVGLPCAAREAFSPSGPPNGYESGHLVGRVTSLCSVLKQGDQPTLFDGHNGTCEATVGSGGHIETGPTSATAELGEDPPMEAMELRAYGGQTSPGSARPEELVAADHGAGGHRDSPSHRSGHGLTTHSRLVGWRLVHTLVSHRGKLGLSAGWA